MVKAEFDDEAKVWIATSADVPGLVVEEQSLEALLDNVGELILILLAENGFARAVQGSFEIPVHIAAQALTPSRPNTQTRLKRAC